jgi:hypothetical protein
MEKYREHIAKEYTQTVEKMDDIVFEKEIQELNEFKNTLEKDLKELEKEVEDFCKSDSQLTSNLKQSQKSKKKK